MNRINPAAAEFLRRLELVQMVKKQDADVSHYIARCPICVFPHNYTLSIWILGNEQMIVHCFGCQDTESIIQEVGVAVADLQPKHVRESQRNEKTQRVLMRTVSERSETIIAVAKKLLAGEVLSELDHAGLLLAKGRIAEACDAVASYGKPT